MSSLSCSNSKESLNILVVGATGLVGSHFLREAQESIYVKSITALSRRHIPLFDELNKVKVVIESDAHKWCQLILDSETKFDVVFSAFATTERDVRSMSKLYCLDYEINTRIAQAAKTSGVQMFVLSSSFNGPIISKIFPYFHMKQTIENEIVGLKFSNTLILRPGPLVGDRTNLGKHETWGTWLSGKVAEYTYKSCLSSLVGESVKAEEVAVTAMYLIETFKTSHSNNEPTVKYVTSSEILGTSNVLESI